VHPDGVVGPGELGEQPAEPPVDLLVGLELGLVEVRQVDAIVEDRPERPVGVPEVVALVLGLGQVGEREVDVALGEEPHPPRLPLHRLARPAEPDAAATLGERLGERHGEPAGPGRAGARGAVGGDDEAARHVPLETPWRPEWQGANVGRAVRVPCFPRPQALLAASGRSRASARIAVSTATWRCRL
jgi:hypothetical protein